MPFAAKTAGTASEHGEAPKSSNESFNGRDYNYDRSTLLKETKFNYFVWRAR